MKRFVYKELLAWKDSENHKPIIVRGARQVGKTHLITTFGQTFKNLVTINFEKQPECARIFDGDLSAKRLMRDLSLLTQQPIVPGETLLFFDEVQEAPRAITALRYFYEECPALHLIAAGSLLDFALEQIGVPVGRVNFLYVYPLSFLEYVQATGNAHIIDVLLNYNFPEPMSPAIHDMLLKQVSEYIGIGGMPEVVHAWVENKNPHEVTDIQHNIIESYRLDFEKYCRKHQIKYVAQLFQAIPYSLGNTFKFSNVPGEFRKRELAPALDLLCKAGVASCIYHSDGQGIPLGGQADLDNFKVMFLDVALAQRILGLNIADWFINSETALVNQGAIIENFVAQEIRAYSNPKLQTDLYYWTRHQRGSSAEIDYLLSIGNKVYPVEVKSGAGSAMKSMRLFLDAHKNSPGGIRISTHNFSQHDEIDSYPLYAMSTLMLRQTDWMLR